MRVRDGGEARGGGAGNEGLRECEGWREEIQGEGCEKGGGSQVLSPSLAIHLVSEANETSAQLHTCYIYPVMFLYYPVCNHEGTHLCASLMLIIHYVNKL